MSKPSRMRVLVFLSVALMMGCANRITPEQRARDDAMKDSIALVDGNKVLGNIRFGISNLEFLRENLSFMMRNDNLLYGTEIQNIDGLFTNADELCQVTFVSCVEPKDSPRHHPYRQFVNKKFGLESSKNNWVVGGRKITLAVENRARDYYYSLRLENRDQTKLFKPNAPKDNRNPFGTFDYYVMYIRNDSLYAVYQREQTEGLKPQTQPFPERISPQEKQLREL